MTRTKYRPSRSLLAALALSSLLATASASIPLTFCSRTNTADSDVDENYQFMSASRCHDNCLRDHPDVAYAVVSYQDCWCSDYAPFSKLDASECGPVCPGWPDELCGGSGLYGYVALGSLPAGTVGAPSSTPEPSPTPTPTPTPTPEPETQMDTSTVLQTSLVVSTRIAESTPDPTPVATPSPVYSFIFITQSGGVSTRVITSIPTIPAAPPAVVQPSSQQDPIVAQHTGLSNGAVAGITIGAILGAALLGVFLFFCCWKKRRGADREGGLNRNTSVLSKVGLMRSGSQKPVMSQEPPHLQTSGPAFTSHGPGPASAGTLGSDSQMSESRRSRPLFVDQRLNPNALFAQSNTSRTSIGTLQDDQDYSRPLEVRNPDL